MGIKPFKVLLILGGIGNGGGIKYIFLSFYNVLGFLDNQKWVEVKGEWFIWL